MRLTQHIRRSGSASTVKLEGGQRAHRPDYKIVMYVGLLMLFGLVLMYAIGPQRANVLNQVHSSDNYSETYFAAKQLLHLGVAVVAFIVTAKIPLVWFKKHAGKILGLGLALCVVLLVFGNLFYVSAITQCSMGACRWFNVGPFGFQPAEFLKFGTLLFLAVFMGTRMKQGLVNDVEKTIIPVTIVALASMLFVVVVQKDMGTGIALGSIMAAIVFMSGVNKKIGAALIAGVLLLGILAVITFPHRMDRVMTFIQGADDVSIADGSGYHIRNALIALGTGGLFGRGIGNSIQATGYLPEAINDSVFAIIGETFGFVGVCLVLGLFTLLLLRLLRIADHLPDPTMQLIVVGVFGWLAAHVILNVASMINVFPLTGITLPLLSFGGTSMLFIAGAMGLAFQVSKYTTHEPVLNNKESGHESTSSRRRIGGARLSGRRHL